MMLFSAACSTAKKHGPGSPAPSDAVAEKRGEPGSPEMMGPPEPMGPPIPPPPEQFGPELPKQRSVVLVLGPGMARGFAHAGAIRALHEAKIPIGAVLGTEIGSLMAGLYALNQNINQFDWMLMRFKREIFTTRRSVFTKVFDKAGRLPIDRELDRAFGKKEFQDVPLPFRAAIEFKNSGLAVVAERGKLVEAIRAAIAAPGMLDPAMWDGALAQSAERSKPFLIEEGHDLHLGPVILIDVSPDNFSRSADLKNADLVIVPDLAGISIADFDKATEISYRGKSAILAKLAEIKRLLKEARE